MSRGLALPVSAGSPHVAAWVQPNGLARSLTNTLTFTGYDATTLASRQHPVSWAVARPARRPVRTQQKVLSDLQAQFNIALMDPLAGLATCLLVAPHGATDLGEAVANGRAGLAVLLIVYGLAFTFAWSLQHYQSSCLALRASLGVFSAFHLRQDLGGRFSWSWAMHLFMLFYALYIGPMLPWRLTIAWLSFWHAPRHFLRLSKRTADVGVTQSVQKQEIVQKITNVAVVATGILSVFVWQQGLITSIPEWLLVGCIIGHACCTELWELGFQQQLLRFRRMRNPLAPLRMVRKEAVVGAVFALL